MSSERMSMYSLGNTDTEKAGHQERQDYFQDGLAFSRLCNVDSDWLDVSGHKFPVRQETAQENRRLIHDKMDL